MIDKLLTEHHLEIISLEARPSLYLSKCQIVGNHMQWLKNVFIIFTWAGPISIIYT